MRNPYVRCVGMGTGVRQDSMKKSYEYSHISDPVLSVDEESFCRNEIMRTPPLPFTEDFEPVMHSECASMLTDLYRTYIRDDIAKEHHDAILSAQFMNIRNATYGYSA